VIFARVILGSTIVFLASCVSTQYTLVDAGQNAVGELGVTVTDAGWNRAPEILTGFLHAGGEMWTRDGILLDRLILVSGVATDGTVFKSSSKTLVYPAFKSNMLPNEVAELIQATLAKYYGAQNLVENSGMRPTRLGKTRAFMFDVKITGTEIPEHHGRVTAFIEDGELNVMIFLATHLHYFEKHWAEAQAVMNSARRSAASAG
jgi:hypothetical protein